MLSPLGVWPGAPRACCRSFATDCIKSAKLTATETWQSRYYPRIEETGADAGARAELRAVVALREASKLAANARFSHNRGQNNEAKSNRNDANLDWDGNRARSEAKHGGVGCRKCGNTLHRCRRRRQ